MKGECYYTSRKQYQHNYEVQLKEESYVNDAIWCNFVTGHTTVTIGVVYRCPNITKQNNENIHNAIRGILTMGIVNGIHHSAQG